jgi:polynucleotide 5'-hydroxyl-kinase GRC3/NOL9
MPVTIDPAWPELLEQLSGSSAVQIAYVMGASDRGKTTLCHYFISHLEERFRTAYIDCDMGQSEIGPPTTLGMRYSAGRNSRPEEHIRFVGSTSPSGHLLQTLCGTGRLLERALEIGAEKIVIDSSGFVLGPIANEFQFQTIDLLQPDLLVAIQRGSELEGLLLNFARHPRMQVRRLQPSPAIVCRSADQRSGRREMLFSRYFADAVQTEIRTARLGCHGTIPRGPKTKELTGLLIGLCDSQNFLVALGIIESVHALRQTITVFAPPFDPDRVASLQFGSLHMYPRDLRTNSADAHDEGPDRFRGPLQ